MSSLEPPIDHARPLSVWLATGLGIGLISPAPGTVGSVVALLPWLLLRELSPLYYAIAVSLAFGLGVWAADRVIRALRIDDPGVIVIDEWIGLWIALFMAPDAWYWALVGLVLFRVFDIWKPWPVRWADRALHGGFGAMLDDALAGAYALLALQAIVERSSRAIELAQREGRSTDSRSE